MTGLTTEIVRAVLTSNPSWIRAYRTPSGLSVILAASYPSGQRVTVVLSRSPSPTTGDTSGSTSESPRTRSTGFVEQLRLWEDLGELQQTDPQNLASLSPDVPE